MQTYVRRQLETGGFGFIPVGMCYGYEEQAPGTETVLAVNLLTQRVDGLESTIAERFDALEKLMLDSQAQHGRLQVGAPSEPGASQAV